MTNDAIGITRMALENSDIPESVMELVKSNAAIQKGMIEAAKVLIVNPRGDSDMLAPALIQAMGSIEHGGEVVLVDEIQALSCGHGASNQSHVIDLQRIMNEEVRIPEEFFHNKGKKSREFKRLQKANRQ